MNGHWVMEFLSKFSKHGSCHYHLHFLLVFQSQGSSSGYSYSEGLCHFETLHSSAWKLLLCLILIESSSRIHRIGHFNGFIALRSFNNYFHIGPLFFSPKKMQTLWNQGSIYFIFCHIFITWYA